MEWELDEQGIPQRYAYVAELDECPGCNAIELLQSQVTADESRGADHGLKIRLRPNAGAVSRG